MIDGGACPGKEGKVGDDLVEVVVACSVMETSDCGGRRTGWWER
jgi:hypothetical protein